MASPCQIGLKCIPFGGQQSQTFERMKASYDLYKCMLIIMPPPCQIGLKCISFGGHQSQTIERMKALYDMHKCMLIIF